MSTTRTRREPRPLSELMGVVDYEATVARTTDGADERVIRRRLEAGRDGVFNDGRLFLFAEVWGGTDENGYVDPDNPGLVGRLRIDPERDMTSRWVPLSDLTGAQQDAVRLWAQRAGRSQAADVPTKVRAWSFRRSFDPMRYPR